MSVIEEINFLAREGLNDFKSPNCALISKDKANQMMQEFNMSMLPIRVMTDAGFLDIYVSSQVDNILVIDNGLLDMLKKIKVL